MRVPVVTLIPFYASVESQLAGVFRTSRDLTIWASFDPMQTCHLPGTRTLADNNEGRPDAALRASSLGAASPQPKGGHLFDGDLVNTYMSALFGRPARVMGPIAMLVQ